MALIVATVIMLAIMSFFVGVYRVAKPAGELDDRLREMLEREIIVPREPKGSLFVNLANKLGLGQKMGGRVALELEQADLALTANEFALLRLGAALAGMIVGALILHNMLLGILLAVLGMQMPVFWLHSRRQQRQHRFQAQLVDVISMLVSGLRAGVGLIQAMDLVRQEMPRPAGIEFGRVVQENGLGVPLEDALGHLLERMPGDDLSMIITVIKIQAEVGGNLANVLDGVITTIRERVRIAQEIRTLTAQQRITGYLLAGLPFFVAGAIMFLNPGFLRPLFSAQWIWLPGMAIVMIVVGFVVISRIVNIQV